MKMRATVWALAIVIGAGGCARRDALDAGAVDAGALDAGSLDASDPFDGGAGDETRDAGDALDGGGGSGGSDAGGGGNDAGREDAGGLDGGSELDAGSALDAGIDAGPIDAGPPNGGCISGGSGTHVARFRWEGSGPGSTAYVVYEANTLPDRSRWRAGAYSRGGIGTYRPTFTDTFLGEGGLELSGTTFIDVELSTASLAHVSNATIAIYGRSFATTSSGSFSWMTFDGSGASPYGGVSNSAPYEWYPADATAALPAGNGGVLLRIEAGPPSNSLVVRRVEICFDAT